MSSIIICADDFGMSESIDVGIIKLIENDRLSATACMVMSPRWQEAAQLITPQIKAKAAIGLHLDFTEFGEAYSLGRLIALSLIRKLPKEVIEIIITKQLDLFESKMGVRPDYIDGHQHVHQLPVIREVLLKVLVDRYQQDLPWIRIAKPPLSVDFKAMVIRLLGARALRKKALALKFEFNTELLGIYDFSGDDAHYKLLFKDWLVKASKSTGTPALMCHPALKQNNTDTNKDPIFKARLIEYEVLNSAFMGKLLEQFDLVKKPN
ncbi:MAG: ChbG/HpnK family deacetylase [Methylotenera sp.]|uniref:ChbG/HpnK family deacetylase n=1 Tax=Methylotenera sp. TaxID=2051956 RepID=UPI002487F747|nr:ChbG/HpnK family deacetylase [Methylotenera sp.]MDI1309466.1 ChbG/HpnK family deacetylase [Methylotenera sp.]